MQQLAENLWLIRYPLHLLGADLHRVVTIIRLASGDLVVHSTGPFTSDQVAAINALGRVRWVLDVMNRHDTFAQEGRRAFPDAIYLAPEGFSQRAGFPTESLIRPAEWGDEIDLLLLEGVPSMNERAVLHRPSRTLIVADLFFNFGPAAPGWTQVLLWLAVGAAHNPGMARSMRLTAKNPAALRASLDHMMTWDFDRLIVGHGEEIDSGAKPLAAASLRRAGYG